MRGWSKNALTGFAGRCLTENGFVQEGAHELSGGQCGAGVYHAQATYSQRTSESETVLSSRGEDGLAKRSDAAIGGS